MAVSLLCLQPVLLALGISAGSPCSTPDSVQAANARIEAFEALRTAHHARLERIATEARLLAETTPRANPTTVAPALVMAAPLPPPVPRLRLDVPRPVTTTAALDRVEAHLDTNPHRCGDSLPASDS